MKRSTTVVSLCLLALCAALAVAAASEEVKASFVGHKVLRFGLADDLDGQRRVRLGAAVRAFNLDLWAEHPEWADVRVPDALRPHVDALDLPYTVMIDDLQALVDLERFGIQRAANDSFFGGFRSLDEFDGFLNTLAKQYPDLVTKITIGKTVEGRDINGVVITSKKNDNAKVGITFNGGQHAREWISPMTNAWIANQLVTLYGKDVEVTKFVDNIEWSIIPIVNADGYVYTWTTDRMWRKNRRVNKNSWAGCIGVDTNRNWAFHWNEGGSSSNTCAEDYMGPAGFSEPEETALSTYIKSRGNVKGYIDFHSYSQLWMTPWGYTTALPANYADLLEATKECVSALAAVHGTKYQYGNIATTIYPASGSSVDWTFGVANVTYSFAVELRDTGRYGFVLPASEIAPTGEETFAAVKAMAAYILKKL